MFQPKKQSKKMIPLTFVFTPPTVQSVPVQQQQQQLFQCQQCHPRTFSIHSRESRPAAFSFSRFWVVSGRVQRGHTSSGTSSPKLKMLQDHALDRIHHPVPDSPLDLTSSLDALLISQNDNSDTDNISTTQKSALSAPKLNNRVYLVGTGPGDPLLLTLRAYQLMKTADVVLYDRLISREILDMVNKDALMIYVGKKAGFHTRTQEEIHQLLGHFAAANNNPSNAHQQNNRKKGLTVLRLKGGDPYIFGRGGEEVEYLRKVLGEDMTVHCVPGITSACGIGADLGIPMTHRGLATSVRFLTGHLMGRSTISTEEAKDGHCDKQVPGEEATAAHDESDDQRFYVDEQTTLVVYMGLSTLPVLVDQIMQKPSHHHKHEIQNTHTVQKKLLSPDTPAVAIERGTTLEQRAVFAPLSQLHKAVQQNQLESPTLIIIGKVVSLAPGWKKVAPQAQQKHEHTFHLEQGYSSPQNYDTVNEASFTCDLEVVRKNQFDGPLVKQHLLQADAVQSRA